MFIGLFISCVGLSSLDGLTKRFTLGIYQLEGGVSMVILIIGIYAVPEILSAAGKLREDVTTAHFEKKRFYVPAKENRGRKFWPLMLQSSIIGTFIGIMPGLGSSTGAMLSYTAAQKTSKNKEAFGTGCAEGIYASEVANNAVTGGALIPMLSLGIPGDSVTAIIMAALILQGISVGPLLFTQHPSLVYVIVLVTFFANLYRSYQVLSHVATVYLSVRLTSSPMHSCWAEASFSLTSAWVLPSTFLMMRLPDSGA